MPKILFECKAHTGFHFDHELGYASWEIFSKFQTYRIIRIYVNNNSHFGIHFIVNFNQLCQK